MAWTYTGNPGDSAKDLVRFLIGDTDQCDQLLQDGEIDYVLSLYNGVGAMNAAIRCCEVIATKFSRLCDESVGQVKLTYSQKSKQYREIRDDLVNRLATEDMQPFAGGISRSADRQQDMNRDRVKPDFTKHMMENEQISPWTTGNRYNPEGGEGA